MFLAEVESSRTSLVSRTHFEVFGLGLESLKSLKIALSSAREQHFFWIVEILFENAKNLAENLEDLFLFSSFGDCLKILFKDVFFWRSLAPVCLVFGIEHFCS